MLFIFIINGSANLLLLYLIAWIIWMLVTPFSWRKVSMVCASFAFVVSLFFYALQNPTNPNHNLAEYFYENGVSTEMFETILMRGGNRLPRMDAALQTAIAHPWFGVGPGNYTNYNKNIDYSDISGGDEYLDPSGLPAINILLEGAINAGIFASVIMTITWLYVLLLAIKYRDRNCKTRQAGNIILSSLLAIFILMQLESNYLRAYLWVFMGLFVGQISKHATWHDIKRPPQLGL
jgi:O-antigen ligase